MATNRKFKSQSASTVEAATAEPTFVEDEVVADAVNEEASETAPPEDVSEVVFSDTESSPATRNVKIRLKKNHSCVIGGERYNFEAGKQVSVPENVKDILMRADMLLPL